MNDYLRGDQPAHLASRCGFEGCSAIGDRHHMLGTVGPHETVMSCPEHRAYVIKYLEPVDSHPLDGDCLGRRLWQVSTAEVIGRCIPDEITEYEVAEAIRWLDEVPSA